MEEDFLDTMSQRASVLCSLSAAMAESLAHGDERAYGLLYIMGIKIVNSITIKVDKGDVVEPEVKVDASVIPFPRA